ncbi:hypothetical protein DRO49_00515 [Candidatus Bathyarchaeota archaeon]|nr:MAG: hypothetical protein DRO49_00515 [Candidatus Bathyarchaeota archaeon]
MEATYCKGHAGLTLLLTSLTLMALPKSDSALQVLVLSTALSTLPDIDLELRRFSRSLHRRGPTHSILFALMAALIFGYLLQYTYGEARWFPIGFISAAWGVVSHLLGDMLTYHPFKPLWPLSQREVALKLCSADNRLVNEGLLTLGGLALTLYLFKASGAIGLTALIAQPLQGSTPENPFKKV